MKIRLETDRITKDAKEKEKFKEEEQRELEKFEEKLEEMEKEKEIARREAEKGKKEAHKHVKLVRPEELPEFTPFSPKFMPMLPKAQPQPEMPAFRMPAYKAPGPRIEEAKIVREIKGGEYKAPKAIPRKRRIPQSAFFEQEEFSRMLNSLQSIKDSAGSISSALSGESSSEKESHEKEVSVFEENTKKIRGGLSKFSSAFPTG